ncbi:MAG: MBL fold metallo-hydrolase, partial [Alcaligenaceae bacterium]|nr:MBL fold metallo-hydrolase [Alcaligenaceae bacterium]
MKITFLGAAGEVTGSCFLVQTGNIRFLVDCGMVQGGRDAPIRNRQVFDFEPSEIDFVLLTHAHIDHSGLLPKLVKDGYTGYIYATPATADLLDVLLPDSAHIQEVEAERAQRKPRSQRGRHYGLTEPIYGLNDALDSLRH